MSDQQLVSVVTACHNAEAFIGETIESVLAQTHHPIEHVIVDDGSSDGSWAMIERSARLRPEQLRVERIPISRGASHTRNRGAAIARGEFLMFLDADDLLSPDALAGLLAALREHPEALAYLRWRRLRPGRRGAWQVRPAGVRRPSSDPDTALRDWLAGSAWVPPCAVLWPRAVFERTGGWSAELTVDDDGELMMRAFSRGVRLIPAASGRALYRMPGSTRVSLSRSAMTEERLRTSRKAVIDRVAIELERQGRLTEFAPAVGTGYNRIALAALQEGHPELAAECQVLGAKYGGETDVSRTALGRALTRMIGFERKERLVLWLAQRGIATGERRQSMRRRKLHAGQHSRERSR